MRPFFHAFTVFAVSIVSLSVGNILLKMGMDRFGALTTSGVPTLQALVKSPQLPIGIVLMIIQFIGTLTLFKWGWDASVVIPIMGLCYVGTAILGKYMLGESVNAMRWFGIFLIIIGVFFIAPLGHAGESSMIQFWQAATALVGILVLMGLASIFLGLLATRRHFANKILPALPEPGPKVTILKPVEGAGPNTYEAFASFCRLDYPGEVEIIIGTIQQDDPVVAIVERLRAAFPERKIQLVFAELQGTNRKTSIMEAMWQQATGQFLFFSDADVAAPKDYLLQLVPRIAQPQVGCLTCLPRGIEAYTLGGKLIALHYGFNFLPQWMLAQQTTGIHWAIGHTMAVPRTVLKKIGGFKNFLNHLADDYELGNRASQLGLRVIVPPLLLDCVVPAESFGAAFTRMQRWKRTIRRSRGKQFLGVIITYPVFGALIFALLQPFAWWSWSAFALVILIRWLLAAGLQAVVKMPDWPRAWWLLPVVDIVEGVTFFGAYFGNTIFWAGRRYTLLCDGTLKELNL